MLPLKNDKSVKRPVSIALELTVKHEIEEEARKLSNVLRMDISPSALIRQILNHRKEIRFIYDKIEETKSG